MATRVSVSEELLTEARRADGGRTPRELVEEALRQYIRRQRIEGLISMLGKTELAMTQEDLERWREDGD